MTMSNSNKIGISTLAASVSIGHLIPGYKPSEQQSANNCAVNLSVSALERIIEMTSISEEDSPKYLGKSLYTNRVAAGTLIHYPGLNMNDSKRLHLTSTPQYEFHHKRVTSCGETIVAGPFQFNQRDGYVREHVGDYYSMVKDIGCDAYNRVERFRLNSSIHDRLVKRNPSYVDNNHFTSTITFLLKDIHLYIQQCMNNDLDYTKFQCLPSKVTGVNSNIRQYYDTEIPVYVDGKYPVIHDMCIKYGIDLCDFSVMLSFLLSGDSLFKEPIGNWSFFDFFDSSMPGGEGVIGSLLSVDSSHFDPINDVRAKIKDVGFTYKNTIKEIISIIDEAMATKLVNVVKRCSRLSKLVVDSGIVSDISLLDIHTLIPDWFMFDLIAEVPSSTYITNNVDPKIVLDRMRDEFRRLGEIKPGCSGMGLVDVINGLIADMILFDNNLNNQYIEDFGDKAIDATIKLKFIQKNLAGRGHSITSPTYAVYARMIDYVAAWAKYCVDTHGSVANAILSFVGASINDGNGDSRDKSYTRMHQGFIDAITADLFDESISVCTSHNGDTGITYIDAIAPLLASIRSVAKVTCNPYEFVVEFSDSTIPTLLRL